MTKDTRVSEIREEYGDIADVMELFGIERVGLYSMRRLATKALTVEWAARLHRVPLPELLEMLNSAVAVKKGVGAAQVPNPARRPLNSPASGVGQEGVSRAWRHVGCNGSTSEERKKTPVDWPGLRFQDALDAPAEELRDKSDGASVPVGKHAGERLGD